MDVGTEATEEASLPPRAGLRRFLPAAVAVLLASPVVVAAWALVGESWTPVGDLAHMVFRTSQVGTGDTPLVGAYTVKGWAHPGPLLFWISAPLYRLTGGDPRGVEWTTAVVNVACILVLVRVLWQRGRWPLLLIAGASLGLLLRGLTPDRFISAWNPFVPLLPFLTTIVLLWDAALGRRRRIVLAALPAAIAMQGHLAFVMLTAVVVVWLVAWCLWWPRLLPESDDATDLPRGPWRTWLGDLRWAVLAMVLLWIGPLVDLVADTRNPWTIAKSLATPPAAIGPIEAVGVVGRYVRPDGPWMGGDEPTSLTLSVYGSGPLPYLLALAVVGACVFSARQRRLVELLAFASLTLVLLVAALPATSQIVLPAYTYLTQWLKIIGYMVWVTAAWTVWTLAEPWLRASRSRLRTVAGAAAAALVGCVALNWPTAADTEQLSLMESRVVEDLGEQLQDRLPRDQRIRVEVRGDFLATTGPGVIYWLIDHGYDIVTSDGWIGLKWGHEHRWSRGDDYDLLLTVAVGATFDPCAFAPGSEALARHDRLTPEERQWLIDSRFRRLADPDALTPAEERRAERLDTRSLRVGVFESPRICAKNPKVTLPRESDPTILPTLLGVAGGALVVGSVIVLRRRSRTSQPPG